MLFSLSILIQAQEPPRLSKLVIAGVAVFLILGVYLLVHFIRRLKSGEKESEEDWSLSRRSLFVADSAPSEPPQVEEINPAATEMLVSSSIGQTRALASEPILEEPPAPAQPESPDEPKAEPPAVSAPPAHYADEPAHAERGTELLASPQLETPAQVKARETIGFDEEIWARLESKEQESTAPVEPARPQQTTELRSPTIEHANSEEIEPKPGARVEQRATRALFEPPRIEQAPNREPFEPPTIKRLAPHEQAEARDRQAASRATRDLYAGGSQGENLTSKSPASDTNLYGEPPARDAATEHQPSPLYEPRGTRELAAEPDLSSNITSVPASDRPTRSVIVTRPREHRAPAGAVLGLPLEGSQRPMVFGHPAKSTNETGIGSLTNYGKPLDKDGGRGGTIALLLAVLIIGGALAAYFFVPSAHSQINALVARLRGVDPNAANQSTEPKASIFTSPSVPEKNIVKAKGAVSNISAGTLENLELEISLERGDKTSEIRNIAITPSQIEPNGQGNYEFEYDGSRETGFIVYKIKRLLSNGTPVRFTSPALK